MLALTAECVAPESNRVFMLMDPIAVGILGLGSEFMYGVFGITPHMLPIGLRSLGRGSPNISFSFPGREGSDEKLIPD